MTAVVVAETFVLILLAVLVAGLLRSHADILRRLHLLDGGGDFDEPPVARPSRTPDTVADVIGASVPAGESATVAVRNSGARFLFAFLSSGCLTCRVFWDAFADGRSLGVPPDVQLVVVTKSMAEESAAALPGLVHPGLVCIASSRAWDDYAVPGAPYFVMVDGGSNRVVGEGTGVSWPQVRDLILYAGAGDRGGAAREARIDQELLASGIEPGDASLYPGGR